jgi:hypothetical protein
VFIYTLRARLVERPPVVDRIPQFFDRRWLPDPPPDLIRQPVEGPLGGGP